MTVFVTTASKHGSTREIGEEIAPVLDEHGVSTKLADIDDATDPSSYAAYVDEIDRWAEEIAGQLSRSPETSLR